MSATGTVRTDSRDARGEVPADPPVSDRRLRLAGIGTALTTCGEGPPVVLLHGRGESGATWTRFNLRLATDHAVIAPDLPGHGASGTGGGDLGVAHLTEWLGELVARTCSMPPVLVGRGLGGAIAARFAYRRPSSLRALVLVDSLGLAPLRPSPRFALALLPFLVRPTLGDHDRLMAGCTAHLDAIRHAMGERLDELQAHAVDRARNGRVDAALGRMMPQLGVPAIPEAELAAIQVPTTLIWGRHDLQVRLAVAQAASARHGWPLHVIEGAADDPAVEQPEAFLRALRAGIAATEEEA